MLKIVSFIIRYPDTLLGKSNLTWCEHTLLVRNSYLVTRMRESESHCAEIWSGWENKAAVDDPGSRVTEQCFAKTQDIQHRPHSPSYWTKKHPCSFITKGQGLGDILFGIVSTESYKFIWLLQDQDAKDQYLIKLFCQITETLSNLSIQMLSRMGIEQ